MAGKDAAVSWLVSPHAPEAYWWLDAGVAVACVVAGLWMSRVDRRGPAK